MTEDGDSADVVGSRDVSESVAVAGSVGVAYSIAVSGSGATAGSVAMSKQWCTNRSRAFAAAAHGTAGLAARTGSLNCLATSPNDLANLVGANRTI